MGNADSSSYDEEEDPHAKFDGIETLGYRVLGVQPNSPASAAGLVSFLDFLVGCDGTMLLGNPNDVEPGEEYDDVDFPLLLKESVGKELTLLVWNIKSQTQRLVKITPSNTWGGTGLLGVTIRLDDYGGADERLVRVLSVEHNSPAAIAGLSPLKDYLLGTTSHSFDDTAVLANVLQANVDRVVELYVYNTESDVVRVVTLMPTLSWGGMGLLGAEVGTGYLHRLPKGCRSTDGRSFERRVRSGPRPGDTASDVTTNAPGKGKKEQNLVNLTVDDGTSGEAAAQQIHFEPQMEMEPDPEEETATKSDDVTENTAETVAKEVAELQITPNSEATTAAEESATPPKEENVTAEAPSSTPQPESAPQQQSATTVTETAPSDVVTPASASTDAASLFAGPPPISDTVASKMVPPPFGGLPPPPIGQLSSTGGVDLR